jgi:hypothetical protein
VPEFINKKLLVPWWLGVLVSQDHAGIRQQKNLGSLWLKQAAAPQ